MLRDNGIDVSIIDFGISKVVEEGFTSIFGLPDGSQDYFSPQARYGDFSEITDYYAFGITLFELFFGMTPYNGINPGEVLIYQIKNDLPFPSDQIPTDLKNLILGLTYTNVKNRHNENNPNRPWGYKEVKRWCEGDAPPLPDNAAGMWLNPIIFPHLFYQIDLSEARCSYEKSMAAFSQNLKVDVFGAVPVMDDESQGDMIENADNKGFRMEYSIMSMFGF